MTNSRLNKAAAEDPRGMLPTWRLASVGIEMGLCVAIGWGMGWYLDGELATGPWLMMVFTIFGVAAGFKGMIQAARNARPPASSPAAPVKEAP